MAWSDEARRAAALARKSHAHAHVLPNTHQVMHSVAPTRVSPAVLYRMFNPPDTKLGQQVKHFLATHPGGRWHG